mmetsp:Transcript_14784/g.34908  ORF Transcript_14784/g.34908 Transcript_14784/m.34908 type:complete len:242 (-) Transcript_14784:980-1705(-)
MLWFGEKRAGRSSTAAATVARTVACYLVLGISGSGTPGSSSDSGRAAARFVSSPSSSACDCSSAKPHSCRPAVDDRTLCWSECCLRHAVRGATITGLSNQRIPTAPTVDAPRVAVCVVGQPRSAALTARPIRRHVLNVLDADAFLVLQIGVSSKGGRRLNQSLAIERLLGPRVRSAVHGTAQDLQPAGLANRLEQGAAAQHARGYVEHEALMARQELRLSGAEEIDCPTGWPRLRQPCTCM